MPTFKDLVREGFSFNDFGIKKGYPNLRKLIGRLSDYVSLTRPLTLFGAWIAGFFLDISFSKPYIDFCRSFFVGITLSLLQAGGQAFNQSIREEVEIDKINGKTYRPTVNGRISLEEGVFISFILFLSGIMMAFYLNTNYGFWAVLITFFAVAYTSPPLRVKKIFFLNNVWQGISRGLLPAIYVASVHKYGFLPILYGIALAIWVTGAQASKDFGDERGDSAYGIKSFPVVLGKDGALKLMCILMGIAFVAFTFFVYMKFLPPPFLALDVLILPSILIIYGLKKNLKLKYAENNLSWVLWYGTLGLFYILPTLLI